MTDLAAIPKQLNNFENINDQNKSVNDFILYKASSKLLSTLTHNDGKSRFNLFHGKTLQLK